MNKVEEAQKSNTSKQVTINHWFSEKSILQIMGIAAPLFYLFGYFHSQGYLATFDVTSYIFPQSSEYYFVSFFNLISTSFISNMDLITWGMLILAPIFISLAVVSYGLDKLSEKIISHWELEAKNGNRVPNKALDNAYTLLERAIPILVKVGILFGFLILITIIVMLSYSKGGDIAKQQKSKFEHCQMDKLDSTKTCDFLLSGNKVILKGLVFAKSNTHYGFWDGKKTHVVPIKNLSLEVRHGTKATNNSDS